MRPSLKWLLSIPVTGAMLALAACSDSPTPSTGGVTLERAGAYTVNLEVMAGTGAIEIYAGSSAENIATTRTAVAEGECPAQGTCKASHTFENGEGKYLKIVYTAKHVGQQQFWMNQAYHCPNSSSGCTTGKVDNMGNINTALTGVALVIDTVAIGGNSLTIGMLGSEKKPTGAGIAGATGARCYDAKMQGASQWAAGAAINPAAIPACALALPAGSPVNEACNYLPHESRTPDGWGDYCASQCALAPTYSTLHTACLEMGHLTAPSAPTQMIPIIGVFMSRERVGGTYGSYSQ